MSDWVSSTNYGRHHGLSGKDGVIEYCKERSRLDLMALKTLGIKYEIIHRK